MSHDDSDFRPADVLACYGGDRVSRAISCVTASLVAPAGLRIGPSHVAMIARHGGESTWIESTTLATRSCRVQARPVSGVQAHKPHERIADYCDAGGRVDLYRLVEIESLSRKESRLLTRIVIDHFVRRGVGYDMRGALLSGTRAFQLTRFFPGADLNELFCSELVAAVLMRLGRLTRTNPTRYNPARLVRRLVRDGAYRLQRRWEAA